MRSSIQATIVLALLSPLVAEFFSLLGLLAAFSELSGSPTASPEELAPHVRRAIDSSRIALALAVAAAIFTSVCLPKFKAYDRWLLWVCAPIMLLWLAVAIFWLARTAVVNATIYVVLLIVIGVAFRSSRAQRNQTTEQGADDQTPPSVVD